MAWGSDKRTKVSNTFKTRYSNIFMIIIKLYFSEWITSVMCLPLISLGKASGPDWTCIAVGYNTGFIRFYTEVSIYIQSLFLLLYY